MKYLVSTDEYYPFCTIEDPLDEFYKRLMPERPEECIELTEEEYADYLRVMKEFFTWQKKLRGIDD